MRDDLVRDTAGVAAHTGCIQSDRAVEAPALRLQGRRGGRPSRAINRPRRGGSFAAWQASALPRDCCMIEGP